MSFHLPTIDFEKHNEEVKRVWEAYRAGRPYRAPVVISANSRIYLLNPALNEEGIGFREYTYDPDLRHSPASSRQHKITPAELNSLRTLQLNDRIAGQPRFVVS